jgi:NADH-quinone oxidoreductase subunit N
MSYLALLRLAGPEMLVVLAALGALLVDLAILRDQPARVRRWLGAAIAGAGCLSAGLYILTVPAYGRALDGMFVADPLTQTVKLVLLGLTLLTVLLSVEADFTDHISEYFALVLLATTGMLLMTSAEDLLPIFLALELTSLSLYALVALRRHDLAAAEAGLKYFFFGAMAAAFALFGFSLLYGLTGATGLEAIATALRGRGWDPLLAVALVLVILGFGFKVAAVPFHLWAPDAYQGAPTPAAALVASGSKVASFFLFAKVLLWAFPESAGGAGWTAFRAGWMPVLALLALASMLLGNLAALAQRGLKRLLAYSAVAHAGYLLLGVLAVASEESRAGALASLVFYTATYALTAIGAFAIAAQAERVQGSDGVVGLAGLARRSPWLAGGLAVLMLSLAGLPPFAGFVAKFYVFAVALRADSVPFGLLWLVAAGLALSPVALYYYLKVLKQAYVVESPVGEEKPKGEGAWTEGAVVGLAAGGVVLFGVFPHLLLGPIEAAVRAAGF